MSSAKRVLAVVFLLGVVALAIWVQSQDWPQIENVLDSGPKCPLRQLTGFRCAFCGMTHAWIAFLKGNLTRSFTENALGIPLFLTSVSGALIALIRPDFWRWNRAATWASMAVLVTYAVGRNLA